MVDDCRTADRRAILRWALCLAGLYAFFYQGGGWNQNARFDTVRALVERGGFEITAFADNTGDVVEYGAEGWLWALLGLCQRMYVDGSTRKSASQEPAINGNVGLMRLALNLDAPSGLGRRWKKLSP